MRVVSALVLAPPAVAALYLGPPYSDGLVWLVAGIAAGEWARLCGGGRLGVPGAVLIVAVLGAAVIAAFDFYAVGGWVIATGAIGAALASVRYRLGKSPWYAVGCAYLGSAVLAFLWLRADPENGRFVVLWLLAVVWATDIGAYAAGRAIGGPRLAPRISPGKTWAGLSGGVAAAAAASVLMALALDVGRFDLAALARLATIGALLAGVAQMGDLFESHLKRLAGVKESSELIPGHGGILDRIDGLLAAALVLGVAVRLTGGKGFPWL